MSRLTTLAVVCFLLVSACDERKEDEYQFIEFVKVRGTCSEDHVGEWTDYEGDLVHWHNVTKDSYSRYGAVHRSGDLVQRVIDEVENPYRYAPPFQIGFSNLTAEQFASDSLRLHGISNYSSDEGSGEDQYWATCKLTVVERLDHLPSSE